MSNIVIIPQGAAIVDHGSYSTKVAIPQRIDCTPTCVDTILSNCGEEWNCELPRRGPAFYNPVNTGDKFCIQSRMLDDYNPSPEAPADGFGTYIIASLLDIQGNVVSTDHTLFSSRYYAGYKDSSFQVMEISQALIEANFPALTCFSFMLESKDTGGNTVDSLCTNHFKMNTIAAGLPCIEKTVQIESEVTTDCCNNTYTTPTNFVGNESFKFYNTWRYYAETKLENIEWQNDVVGSTPVTSEVDELTKLTLRKPIPPYLFKQLIKAHLSRGKVSVDGVEYITANQSFETINAGCMKMGTIDLITECDSTLNC